MLEAAAVDSERERKERNVCVVCVCVCVGKEEKKGNEREEHTWNEKREKTENPLSLSFLSLSSPLSLLADDQRNSGKAQCVRGICVCVCV